MFLALIIFFKTVFSALDILLAVLASALALANSAILSLTDQQKLSINGKFSSVSQKLFKKNGKFPPSF